MNDPYQLLGVTPDSSAEEVTKAYRRLAKKNHPDLHPDDPSAVQKMTAINNAYDEIERRRTQKSSFAGTSGYSSHEYSSGGEGDWNEIEILLAQRRAMEAMALLLTRPNRSAHWHYLMAAAHAGLGNLVAALEEAETAVRLDSLRSDYRELRDLLSQRLADGGRRRPRINPLWTIVKTLFYLGLARWFLSFIFG